MLARQDALNLKAVSVKALGDKRYNKRMPRGYYPKNQEHDLYNRLLDKIVIVGDCWVWTGANDKRRIIV
jgi:hypothetical protein